MAFTETQKTIDAGIGKIFWSTTDSLDLVRLMEAFTEVVKEHGAQKLLKDLEDTYGV